MLLFALTARAGVGTVQLIRADEPSALEFPDEVQYWKMARSLREGGGLRDELGFRATRMPLYPALLSLFAGSPNGVVKAKAFQWIIGSVAAVLTAGLATTMFDHRVGLLAGVLVAIDPFLVFFSSLLLTETLYLAALVALWWILWRCHPGASGKDDTVSYVRWVAAGLAAALCVYIRESSAGLVLVALAFIVIARRFDRRTLLGAAIVGAVIVASLVPWAVRNRRVTGDFCWLTHRGGISLYDGVRPQATGASDLGAVKQMPAVAGLDEVAWNRYFLQQSIEAIASEPGRILRLAAVKVARLWNPIPNAQTYRSGLVRLVAATWTIPTFACAAAAVVILRRRGKGNATQVVLFLLLPALYLTALHSLFVGSVRYRLGAIPFIEVLAAATLVAVIDSARKRGSMENTGVAD